MTESDKRKGTENRIRDKGRKRKTARPRKPARHNGLEKEARVRDKKNLRAIERERGSDGEQEEQLAHS